MLSDHGPLRVAVLCSKRAPGLRALLDHPRRRRAFEIVCVITTEQELGEATEIEAKGIPVLTHPIRRFHQECGATLRDMDARSAYDAMTVHVLQQLDVDVVVMLGYLYVATEVLLSAFPERVLNVHDSDLEILGSDGERRYVGLRSTRDAIVAGEVETRSTVHLVTGKVDAGRILMRSEAYPVAPFVRQALAAGATDVVKAYAYAQREWMMRHSWGAMVGRILELMATVVLRERSRSNHRNDRAAGGRLRVATVGLA